MKKNHVLIELQKSEDRLSKAHAQYFVIVFVRSIAKSTHATFITTDKLRAKSADTVYLTVKKQTLQEKDLP